MEKSLGATATDAGLFSLTLRDVLLVAFRNSKLILLTFCGVFFAVLVYAFYQIPQYRAEMKILVQQERVDPVVTPDQSTVLQNRAVTAEEINSEVELILSRDLLSQVAAATTSIMPADGEPELTGQFEAAPLQGSNLISVAYTCPDPQEAVRVLEAFARLYLEKHLQVHRSPGVLEFFQRETDRYRKGLENIETRIASFAEANAVGSIRLVKEATLQRLSDFEAKLKEVGLAIAETEEKMRVYESQLAATPQRLTTSIQTSENQGVVGPLKSNLVTLELKRAELLGKYDPTYRAIQDVDRQIEQVRTALADEEKVRVHAESSDRNPAYLRLSEQLAGTHSELPALRARGRELTAAIKSYKDRLSQLEQKELVEHDLLRAQRMAEENYQLYVRKHEEVRISKELDKQRILNVSIVERATVPKQPTGQPRSTLVLIGGVLAGLMSIGLGLVAEYTAQSFRTPGEVEAILGIPVLAALRKRRGHFD